MENSNKWAKIGAVVLTVMVLGIFALLIAIGEPVLFIIACVVLLGIAYFLILRPFYLLFYRVLTGQPIFQGEQESVQELLERFSEEQDN